MRILSFSVGVLLLINGASAFAANEYASRYANTGSESSVAKASDVSPLPLPAGDGKLVNVDYVTLSRQISDLESRIANLERENRYQNERARRMDRILTDLKRRK